MRIVCSSVEDFIENLEDEAVHRGVVYVNRTRKALNGRTAADATSWEVILQASAVIEFPDGQSLVECGESCGIDRATADGCDEGAVRMRELLDELESFCDGRNLTIKPGVIDIG